MPLNLTPEQELKPLSFEEIERVFVEKLLILETTPMSRGDNFQATLTLLLGLVKETLTTLKSLHPSTPKIIN